MNAKSEPPRRLNGGSYLVPVDELQIGDRLRYRRNGKTLWQPISGIEELPYSRRINFNGESWRLRRRTTLIVRAARTGESS